ncbi:PLP-dependent aminotransferase family protein [Variovorax terrae]|uniref:PLP-dependent aminotransferase family protein n=1 Tax=Variovorax terrae TaxID=2923278 RepID=A0A9X1VWV8_9BURK|nr:PLP-dependent aminotransferase family protein [Variovorax terrae]MCJ0765266.1 PLP-dependent aminotransferase family protein [Variovorax terrae]
MATRIQMRSPLPMPHTPEAPIYQQLAAHYREAIEKNALRLGMRMPSVRELMRRHAVSLSTALQTLRVLEERGWLEARPRVGYFVRNAGTPALEEMSDPDLREPFQAGDGHAGARFTGINERISLLVESGRRADIRVDLGGATPGEELFDTRWMNRSAAALLREQPGILAVGRSTAGTHPEFQAAMAHRALKAGMRLAPQDVMATSGNTEAVHLALAAVAQPGDVVAVESPTYYGLLQGIESLGLKTLEIPCSQHTGISLEALDLAVRTEPRLRAVVVVPDLQMPLGTLMPDGHKAALVKFCAQHGLALVEDDSYRLLVEAAEPPRPIKAWDVSGHVIYCESLNKTLAPGLRQGWMTGGRWHERVQMLKFAQSRNTNTLGQLLAARWTAAPAFERHLLRLRPRLRSQRERMAQAIARYFPAGTRLRLPPGGLSLWIQLPDGVSSSSLFEQALRQGIRIAPGAMFSNTARYDGFLRLSCALAFTDGVDGALRTLGQLAGAGRA